MKTFSLILLLYIFSLGQVVGATEIVKPINKQVRFTVTIDTAIKAVPVLIIYQQTFYAVAAQNVDRTEYQPINIKGHTYTFLISDQSKPAYFSLAYKKNSRYKFLLSYYHYEPGDQVTISVKPGKIAGDYEFGFSGKGVAKYNCHNDFLYALRAASEKMRADRTDNDELNNYNMTLRYVKAEMEVLNKYKTAMSDFSYQLLRADMIGERGTEMLRVVQVEYLKNQPDDNVPGDEAVANDYFKRYKILDVTGITDSILLLSVAYADYRCKVIKTDRLLTAHNGNNLTYLDHISKIENQNLRDKVTVITLIHSWMAINKNYDQFVADALKATKNVQCLAKIREFSRNSVGSKPFNFSLTDMHGKTVALADFKGKAVFVDYYFTGCTNCKIYYKRILSQVEKKYAQNKNVVFISISIDSDKDKWLNGIKTGSYNSPDGINLYTEGEGSKSDVIRYHNIIGYPTLMLIGKDGRIIKFADFDLRDEKKVYQEIDRAIAM